MLLLVVLTTVVVEGAPLTRNRAALNGLEACSVPLLDHRCGFVTMGVRTTTTDIRIIALAFGGVEQRVSSKLNLWWPLLMNVSPLFELFIQLLIVRRLFL